MRISGSVRVLVGVICMTGASSAGADPRLRWEALPTPVSGTLRPLVIAIQDSALLKESDPKGIASLELKGEKLSIDSAGSAPFFGQTMGGTLEFVLREADGKSRKLGPFHLPRMDAAEWDGKKVHFEIREASEAILDGQALEVRHNRTERGIPETLGTYHVLELRGGEPALPRLYQLWLEDDGRKRRPERDHRVTIGTGSPVRGGGGNVLGYGYSGWFPYIINVNVVAGGYLYTSPTSPSTHDESSVTLGLDVGTYLFRHRQTGFDPLRVMLGATVVWDHLTITDSDAYAGYWQDRKSIDQAVRAGLMIRDEPLRYGNFGFGIGLKFLLFNSPDYNNVRGQTELSYHF